MSKDDQTKAAGGSKKAASRPAAAASGAASGAGVRNGNTARGKVAASANTGAGSGKRAGDHKPGGVQSKSREPLPLGLDREDVAMASSRAAADAERDRRYRFWRGVSILAAVAVILAAWAYVNASHLGLPVERWERQLRETIAEVAGGGGKLAEEHGAGADAPIVNEPDQSPATGGLSREELEEIEGLLAELDFEPGPVDGKIDDATRQAIRDYQAIAGTAETGEASRALLRELREVQAIMERENKAAN